MSRKNFRKTVDGKKICVIILYSAMNMTQTVEYAQYATGGRLGVR